MSDSLQTALDRPYGQTAEAHAAAVARVSREPDAAELLAMLGLAVLAVLAPAETPGCCPLCGNGLPKSGTCRKTNRCRQATRLRGGSA